MTGGMRADRKTVDKWSLKEKNTKGELKKLDENENWILYKWRERQAKIWNIIWSLQVSKYCS